MHIKENKKKKIFYTRYRLFKYLIIFFNLYSILAIFQQFINNIFREYLDIFILIYINNFFIYSNSLKEYKEYIYKIFKILRENNLQINIKKYRFYIKKILYFNINIE